MVSSQVEKIDLTVGSWEIRQMTQKRNADFALPHESGVWLVRIIFRWLQPSDRVRIPSSVSWISAS